MWVAGRLLPRAQADPVSQNHVYDERNHSLQIYWSERDVISWLAENSDDEHLKKVKQTAEQHALKMEVTSRSVNDESALFDDDGDDDEQIMVNRTGGSQEKETSKQRLLSMAKVKPQFEGLRTNAAGHRIQDIKELMSVPVRTRYPSFWTTFTDGCRLPGYRDG
jgi:protein SSD1